MIEIKQTINGKKNLQIFRIGESYKNQKKDIFLKEWTNVFFSPLPQPPESDYVYYDVRKGIPFGDNTFDAVYALRMIEHLSFHEGEKFVRELLRVLKPGGIVRLTAPDLGDIVREYLKQLGNCSQERTRENAVRYHWSVFELYDQMVREKSGGEMIDAIKQQYFDRAYCQERYRDVFEEFVPQVSGGNSKNQNQKSIFERIKRLTVKTFIIKLNRVITNKLYWRRANKISKTFEGDPRKILEANKWMYDRLSLRLLLEEAGFKGGQAKSYKESDIPDWGRYNFDQSNYGDYPIEPSVYFEARK